MAPATRYARSGDANIAFQVHGDGPVDVLLLTGMLSNVETLWEEPGLARAFDRIARFGRLILMDRRGVGMSDRMDRHPTFEEDVADIDAVLDAAGSASAAVFGTTTGTPAVVRYASARPERTRALILYGAIAGAVRSEELPWLDTPEERRERMSGVLDRWCAGATFTDDDR